MLAGMGMMAGNFFGGYLADRFSPAKATATLLLVMVITLVIVHYVSFNPILALVMTFITGAVSFALAAPIQMLMINTAKGSEMIAASVSQASFNIGNALGAFFWRITISIWIRLHFAGSCWCSDGLCWRIICFLVDIEARCLKKI